jgi:Fe-S oxidoreductase
VLAARADVVAQGKEPEKVRQIKEHLLTTGNLFGLPADARFQSLAAADVFRPRAEVLYYVGCDTAYLQPEIASALVRILRAARVDFSVLRDERSTGKPLWLLGYRADALAMAQDLVAQIRATQCRTLVTGCPSSFNAFVKDYPAMGLDLGGIEVLHTTQYLERLCQQHRLVPRRAPVSSATLLDGTYLGRTHAILDEPRQVLERLPGLDVREMGWSRELAYASGEPGGIFRLLQPDLSRQMATRVLAEAAQTRAEVLVTTCPATKTALAGAQLSSPRVLDLVELLDLSLGQSNP